MSETLNRNPSNEQQFPPPEVDIHTPEPELPKTDIPQGEHTPFYALDVDRIRAEVAAALIEKPETAPALRLTEERHLQEGRVDDVHKAEAMAYAEDPYRVAAKAIIQDLDSVPDSTFGDLYKLSPLRAKARFLNPFRWTKLTAKSLKIGYQWAVNDMKRQNAAQIVGEQYDKMVAAALPYVPKLELPKLFHPEEAETAAIQDTSTNTEEPIPNSIATERLVEQLKLDTQLAEQTQVWVQADIVKRLDSGKLGVQGADGHEYPVPSPEQLRDIVNRHAELIEYKASQGFTRLVLVPTAAPTDEIAAGMKRQVATHSQAGNLHDNDGKPVPMDTENATHPEQWHDFFNTGSVNGEALPVHDLESKTATIDPPTPGWKVLLMKNMPELPYVERDLVFLGDRPEFLPGAKPETYLEYLRHDKRFRGEVGLNLKMWYAYAITELERNGTLVDSSGKTLLLGSYVPSVFRRKTKQVPSITWSFWRKNNGLIIETQGHKSKGIGVIMAGVRTAVELS